MRVFQSIHVFAEHKFTQRKARKVQNFPPLSILILLYFDITKTFSASYSKGLWSVLENLNFSESHSDGEQRMRGGMVMMIQLLVC